MIVLKEILEFFETIEKIKRKEREGWKKSKVKGVVETIGSHSFGAALLGWFLAEKEGLDKEKIIKLLLVHDLVMAQMQDITPYDKAYAKKKDIENGTIGRLLEKIPQELKSEFQYLIREYQKEETKESRLAREADKLDTLLQAFFYSKENNRKEILQDFLSRYEKFFGSKTGMKIFRRLKISSVEMLR